MRSESTDGNQPRWNLDYQNQKNSVKKKGGGVDLTGPQTRKRFSNLEFRPEEGPGHYDSGNGVQRAVRKSCVQSPCRLKPNGPMGEGADPH